LNGCRREYSPALAYGVDSRRTIGLRCHGTFKG
jgi:hypothetical protein